MLKIERAGASLISVKGGKLGFPFVLWNRGAASPRQERSPTLGEESSHLALLGTLTLWSFPGQQEDLETRWLKTKLRGVPLRDDDSRGRRTREVVAKPRTGDRGLEVGLVPPGTLAGSLAGGMGADCSGVGAPMNHSTTSRAGQELSLAAVGAEVVPSPRETAPQCLLKRNTAPLSLWPRHPPPGMDPWEMNTCSGQETRHTCSEQPSP